MPDNWARQTQSFKPDALRQVSLHRAASRHLFGTEALEWVQSVFLFILGVMITSHPRIATGSILVVLFQAMHDYGMALLMLILGGAGVVSLIKRGDAWWIRARVACSIARSLMWLSFVLSMSFLTSDVGHISPMMVAYSSYTVGEIAITYTLARNVRPS